MDHRGRSIETSVKINILHANIYMDVCSWNMQNNTELKTKCKEVGGYTERYVNAKYIRSKRAHFITMF